MCRHRKKPEHFLTDVTFLWNNICYILMNVGFGFGGGCFFVFRAGKIIFKLRTRPSLNDKHTVSEGCLTSDTGNHSYTEGNS